MFYIMIICGDTTYIIYHIYILCIFYGVPSIILQEVLVDTYIHNKI